MKRDEKLDIEDLKKLSKNFMDKAVQVNISFSLIKQYSSEWREYEEAIRISPAYYNTVQNALVESTLMKLVLIYDREPRATNIIKLLDNMIAQDYSKYFNKMVIEDWSELGKSASIVLKDIRKKYKLIEKYVERLFKQRNRIYAHSDKATILTGYEPVVEEFGLTYKIIDTLIEYALEAGGTTEVLLTGTARADKPVNFDDWKNTLWFVRNGMKYQKVEEDVLLKKMLGENQNETKL